MLMDDWIKDVKKKSGVDTDGYYGKQCMDLYNDYCHRVLEVEGKTGCAEARLIITKDKTIKKYTKQIKNTPSFIPQKGDIAVWTGGKYGHVAIVRDNKSTVNVLRTIDQNWTPLKLTEVNHNYTYMAPLYFLRPLDQSNINPKKEEVKEEPEKIPVESEPEATDTNVGTVESSAEEKTEDVEIKPTTDNTTAEEETKPAEDTVNLSENQSTQKSALQKIIDMVIDFIISLFK